MTREEDHSTTLPLIMTCTPTHVRLTASISRKSFYDPEHRTSSVDDQKLFAENYAKQHGFELMAFHGDNGITGATMERPDLQVALSALKAEKATILIIQDVDRLCRDQEHLSYMCKLFTTHDIILHTVAAGRIDDLTFAFKGVIGEQQRARSAYTTSRGLRGKATRGGATGGKIMGYVKEVLGLDASDRQTDRLVICEEEAAFVRRIFQLYADDHSLKQICKSLNADGIPSPSVATCSGCWSSRKQQQAVGMAHPRNDLGPSRFLLGALQINLVAGARAGRCTTPFVIEI